ncbi:MAG: hypothetical protein DDT30_01916 [Dehalococcoidia bacterium]|nr:hypothetical protein [Bacillota bacterium]MBT9143902.1 hypothetical protein [Bacillota bacterium]
MELIWEGLVQAVKLLLAGDPEMIQVTLLTLQVSGTATLINVIIGVPLGVFLALQRFRGRNLAVSVINTPGWGYLLPLWGFL